MNERYSRQELFSQIGIEGQEKIRQKHVLVIGAGALGSTSAEGLARAGVGKLTLVDRDYVEWSNLQRQQLYMEKDAQERLPKVVAAKKRLSSINSDVELECIVADVGVEELEQLVSGVDLILDATDNFDIRMMINDISQKMNIPWIYGACVGSYGICYTILPGKTPCLQCILETIPMGGLTCETVGIISPAVQMVVSYQLTEAMKLLVEDYEALRKNLVSFDLWKNQFSSIDINKFKKENCLSCGTKRIFPNLSFSNQTKTAVLCGRDAVQIRPSNKRQLDLDVLVEVLSNHGIIDVKNSYLLSVYIDRYRLVVFKDGRVLIHGTKDVIEAKSIYHRYIG